MGFHCFLDKNKLVCKNAYNGNNAFELKPLSNTQFVLDENAQVEFVKDNFGRYSMNKVYVNNGDVFEVAKK